jgi:hypothetical protein
MALTSTTARQLCTKTELALFTESLARNVKSLDEKALRSRVARSRRLRDKYRQLAHRQDREAHGKQEARRRQPSKGSAATRKKEQMFAESLARFEKQLAKVEAAKRKAAKKPARTSRTAKKAGSGAAAKGAAVAKKTAGRKTKVAVTTATASASPASKVGAKTRVEAPAASEKATTIAKKSRFVASGLTRKRKHLSAQNRRRQASRDAR